MARATFLRRGTDTPNDTPTWDSTSLLAAAARLNTTTRIGRRVTVPSEGWQTELWEFFDSCGEFEYAQNWLAQSCSRAELVVEQVIAGSDEPVEITTGPARVLLDELLSGTGGQDQFLYRTTIHIGTVGETYVVGVDQVNDVGTVSGYRWFVVDASELISGTAGELSVRDPEGGDDIVLSSNAVILRIWRPHPREFRRAHSPAKAVLPMLRMLQGLDKHVGAGVDSRLAGNGILVVPKGMTLTTPDGETIDTDNVLFMQTLVEALLTPIADRDSPAAVVPLLLQAAGEHIDKIRHITFSTPFDMAVEPLTDKTIKRLALGLNMPPEQLLGVGDANHWGSWQIEESGVKINVAPTLATVTSGLTERWHRPMLKLMGIPDPDTYRIVAKTDSLVLRPNRAADAAELHDRLLISDSTYRDVTGFDEGDAPEQDQLTTMVLRKLLLEGKLDLQGPTNLGNVTLIPIEGPPAAGTDTAETGTEPADGGTPATEGDTAPAAAGVRA